jgi:hypothetical protein
VHPRDENNDSLVAEAAAAAIGRPQLDVRGGRGGRTSVVATSLRGGARANVTRPGAAAAAQLHGAVPASARGGRLQLCLHGLCL